MDSQTGVIIGYLEKTKGYSREEATKMWLQSKTYEYFIKHPELWFVSAARMYDELCYELNNNPLWLMRVFD